MARGRGPRRFKQLSIMGAPYSFTWRAKEMAAGSKDDFGETCSDSKRVSINSEKHQRPSDIENTLLHELFHAVLAESGQAEYFTEIQEEALVRALENGMHPLVCRLVELGYFRSKG